MPAKRRGKSKAKRGTPPPAKVAAPLPKAPGSPNGRSGPAVSQLPPRHDTALRLLNDIKAHRLDPGTLTPKQRRACLVLLANGSQTSPELAALFKVSAATIRKDLRALREELGREVREWSMEEVVGQLSMVAEKTTAHAMKADDPGLAWTIQRDFARLLKELGVLRPAGDQSGLRLTVEAIGEGYDRAKEALSLALNPTLTGMHPQAKAPPLPGVPRAPATLDVSPRPPSSPQDEFAVPQTGEGDPGDTQEGEEGPQPPAGPSPLRQAMGFKD